MYLQEKTFEILENTNLNWSVNKKPLLSNCGLSTESFGLFRNDNNKWLGTVGKRYVPYQNAALVETIVKASEGISNTIVGGSFGQGKKVYLQISLEDKQIENDTVKRYITAINSHDGSTSIAFGSTNTVVVCTNTFYIAYKQLSKVRHTLKAEEKIEMARKELMRSINSDNELMENYERMTEHPVDKPIFSKIIDTLFKESMEKNRGEISTRKANQMNKFNNVLEQELASHGNTLWGLFNAVTYYTNHIKPRDKNKKDEYVMTGEGAKLNFSTYQDIMNFINSKEKKVFQM